MRIAIIGCGNMGTGIAERLSASHQMLLYDRDWNWTQELAKKVNGEAFQNIQEAVEKAQIIFLSIKPQNLHEVASTIKSHLRNDHIVISLLAGTPLSVLRVDFSQCLLVRIMPNLAIRYGEGVIGIVESPNINVELRKKLEELLCPLGMIYWLKEDQVDALTSLTSSAGIYLDSRRSHD